MTLEETLKLLKSQITTNTKIIYVSHSLFDFWKDNDNLIMPRNLIKYIERLNKEKREIIKTKYNIDNRIDKVNPLEMISAENKRYYIKNDQIISIIPSEILEPFKIINSKKD